MFGSTVPAALQGKVAPAPRSKFAEDQAAISRDPLTQARMKLMEIRRQQLTGRERPVLLQAAEGDGSYPYPNVPMQVPGYYPRSSYPDSVKNNIAVNPSDKKALADIDRQNTYPAATPEGRREINLEDEKMRQLAFGYSRNEKGEKVPYEKLLQRTHTVTWTCPNCGCSYNLPA